MPTLRHDCQNAERIAYHYHIMWAVLCLLTVANYIFAMVVTEPIASINHPLALPFKFAYWFCLAQIFMGAFGLLWHVFGARQHGAEIRKLNG